MEGGRLFTGIYNFCNWVCYFFYLNIMWIFCTLLGGVLFGITPSTVALYTIARKTAIGEEDIPVFRTFWEIYKGEFFKSNVLGILLIVIGVLWYVDLSFFRQQEGNLSIALNVFMTVVGVLYIMLLLYIFPIYVHYKMKLFNYIKYAISIGFLRPGNFLAILITSVSTYYFFVYFQKLIPFIGFSLLAHLNMWLALQSFNKVAEKNAYYQKPAHYHRSLS